MSSTRCEQSLDSFRLLFWKMSENDHITLVDSWVSPDLCMREPLERDLFSLSSIENATVRLKYYRLFIVKTTWGLIIKNVWNVSTIFTDTIWNLHLPVVTCTSLWITQQNAPTKWRFLDIKIIFIEQKTKNIYCVTGSLGSANIRRSSKVSDHFIAFLTFVTNLLCC